MMTFEEKIKTFEKYLKEAKNVVFFGGAGVSVPSGIPDFRSATGIYHRKTGMHFSAERIVSNSFFYTYPDLFEEFYYKNMVYVDAKPNSCHLKLAELEKRGKVKAVVTQNIDGLHQLAGSKNVFELHGTIHRSYCIKCHTLHNLEETLKEPKGKCKKCGAHLKPDVVLFEEPLDNVTIIGALNALSHADTLIVGGTSLVVQPAASFIYHFKGKRLIVVNKTPIDSPLFLTKETLIFVDDIERVFKALNLDNI